MPDALQDIRNWLRGRPDWLQQAAEILLAAGTASDADIQTLVERLKSADGQQVTTARAFDALRPAAASASALRLVKIGDISGIENLNPRTPLTFGAGNLSVIYGHNGSGKSGYARLLKRACGKPRAKELMPNVFQAPPASRKCRIDYQQGGDLQQREWPATGSAIDDLRAVDVFDADAALFYLREETSATYTPPAVALFETLASVCDRVKARLQTEQSLLISALPLLPQEYANTDVGTAYRTLRADVNEVELQQFSRWSAEDDRTLRELSQRLGVVDPAGLASKKRAAKAQVDELSALVNTAAVAFGEARLEDVRRTREAARDKRRIATESAHVDSAKLVGVGSDTWRAMWQAARAYSQIAYPGKDYPVSNGDSRCVLCHQILDREAKGRLRDFEEFVQGALEKDADSADTTYRQSLIALPNVLTQEDIALRCQAADMNDEVLVQRLCDFWFQVRRTRSALLDGEVHAPATPITLPEEIIAALTTWSRTLEQNAKQNEGDAAGFDRVQAIKEKMSLDARHWISQQIGAIRTEVARLLVVNQYDEWKLLANSSLVSRKAGEIAERVITQAFVDRFNRELKALGAVKLKVELTKTRTERGRALHRLRLKGTHGGKHLPDAVLSEGERRIVGLAAFLADVAEKPHSAPFVFDDPISSLDHEFEWHVATRLAELARSRQVLVFTHRLSLYGAMEDAAKKIGDAWKKENLEQRHIESFDGAAGHPADEGVSTANTKAANNILLTRLDEAKKAGQSGGASAYRLHAQGICTDFRKLLERTVEDDLLNQVVRRHRRSITTDNRLGVLSQITADDCRFIDDLMTKYSTFEHSQSPETPVRFPDESELREDLGALKSWREGYKKRGELSA